ncbi:MAG: asparagine synthase (glutamine-hydrolyzing) [Vicinamibacterales bacterium]
MCGIVGLWFKDPARSVAPDEIERMCDAIVHRGPDDSGIHVDGNFGMGMRRLSIVDLAGGHQPIWSESGDVGVVYNGEIYNYRDLRDELTAKGHRFRTESDTETLVHGHETWSRELPRHLNGMFAYCAWDRVRRQVCLARDHMGVKPLYVYEDERCVAWASEIKAIRALSFVDLQTEPDALLDFLSLGYVPAPLTMFRRIRKLPPATILTLDSAGSSQQSYWRLEFHPEQRTEADWCANLRELVDDAVRRQLMADVPLGAFLSGGIDSSLIVATMARLGVERISTYSIGFGGEDAFHNELDKARIVSDRFRTDHHEIVVEPDVAGLIHPLLDYLDEPVTDTSFIVTYLVSKLARESVKVILSGVGGDEVFAGYRRYVWPLLDRYYRVLPAPVRTGIVAPLLQRLPVDRGSRLKAFFRHARGFVAAAELPQARRYRRYVGVFDSADALATLTPEMRAAVSRRACTAIEDAYEACDSPEPLDRMLYADQHTALVDSLLMFTDKMSMAVSLEARVPLLDVRLVELAARIPASVRLPAANRLKHILKMAMADRLPPEIVHRRKQGFGTPMSRWLRGSLRPLVNDLLGRDRLRRTGVFDPDRVWRLIDDHVHQKADFSEHIMAILSFQVWHDALGRNPAGTPGA